MVYWILIWSIESSYALLLPRVTDAVRSLSRIEFESKALNWHSTQNYIPKKTHRFFSNQLLAFIQFYSHYCFSLIYLAIPAAPSNPSVKGTLKKRAEDDTSSSSSRLGERWTELRPKGFFFIFFPWLCFWDKMLLTNKNIQKSLNLEFIYVYMILYEFTNVPGKNSVQRASKLDVHKLCPDAAA